MFSFDHTFQLLACALALAAGTPARAELSGEMPDWWKLGLEVRGRSDHYFGWNGAPDTDASWYLHRLRLNFEIRARPWLSFVAQGQDSRVAGYDASPVPNTVEDSFDLRQAYVRLGGGGERQWSLEVGRQPLIFGDMRLVSTSNWGNVGPNFDAVRLGYRRARLRVDTFASLVVIPDSGFDRPRRDRKLSGIYASVDTHAGGTTEAYVFWKSNRNAQGETGPGDLDVYTYGVRSVGNLPLLLDYNVEMALQRGHVARDGVEAWAGHWELGRKLWDASQAPRLALEYNYGSGDRNPHDGRYGSFDQLYPTNVYGTAGDFGWRNLHEPVIWVGWQPAKKWKVKTAYHGFWLASRQDALYTFSGAAFAFEPRSRHSRVGTEEDTRIIYQVTGRLQLWCGYAHLFPGPYLRDAHKGAVSYPYFMWTYTL